jgi:hypothetical protein
MLYVILRARKHELELQLFFSPSSLYWNVLTSAAVIT